MGTSTCNPTSRYRDSERGCLLHIQRVGAGVFYLKDVLPVSLLDRKAILSPKEHSLKSVPHQVFGFDAPFVEANPSKMLQRMTLESQAVSVANSPCGHAQMKTYGRKISPPIDTPPASKH